MQEIKCPNCGKVFQIDETSYESIVKQIRDNEFNKQISEREKQYKTEKENEIKLAEAHIKEELQKQINDKDIELADLKNQVANIEEQTKIFTKTGKEEIDEEAFLIHGGDYETGEEQPIRYV